MVLKLAIDEVQEVHRALSAAYREILRALGQVDGSPNRKAGLELCRRKRKIESLLLQLERAGQPGPMREMVLAGAGETLLRKAA